jgi:hypothetical protein
MDVRLNSTDASSATHHQAFDVTGVTPSSITFYCRQMSGEVITQI